MSKKPYLLLIRDGWGYNPDYKHNAIHYAKTPNHDRYIEEYPTALVVPSGEGVGLPPANMGSSEVGHLNMGAGRVVYQSLVRIDRTIEDGSFFKNEAFIAAMEKVKSKKSNLHLWGLVQDQGVHAHQNHLVALLELAAKVGLAKEQVIIHVFGDGRDTLPKSVKQYLAVVEQGIEKSGVGVFGSIIGRYYAMDRDMNWDRVQLAYDLLVDGKSDGEFSDIYQAIDSAYDNGETDEFIKPRTTTAFKAVEESDSVIFFNYRLDRTRELTKAFVLNEFDDFPAKKYQDLDFVCFTEYYDGVANSSRANVSVAFPPNSLANLFGKFLADKGMKQLRIAETEKFAHVTFFFNGQSDIVFENEEHILIPSPKVATYDLQPEMSAYEVTEKAVEAIQSDTYDVIVLNFANPDMVGHTGVWDAVVKACEVVDECVGKVVDEILKKDGVVFLTSDHGNADQMVDYSNGETMTAHTNNLVWLSLISERDNLQLGKVVLKASGGRLADVIPSMIDVMGLEKPAEMEGETLLNHL